jgi:hypothetical protein
MAYQNFVEGIAVGLIITGRYDLLHMKKEVEKVGINILARKTAKGEEPPDTPKV